MTDTEKINKQRLSALEEKLNSENAVAIVMIGLKTETQDFTLIADPCFSPELLLRTIESIAIQMRIKISKLN